MRDNRVRSNTRIVILAGVVALINTLLLGGWLFMPNTWQNGVRPQWLDAVFVTAFFAFNFTLLQLGARRITWLLESWQYRADRLWENWDRLQDAPSPMLLSVKDHKGRYQRVNQAFEEMFGVSAASARGKTDLELFPSRYADAVMQGDARALAKRHLSGSEDRFPVGDDTHDFYTIRVPLWNQRGEAKGLFTIAIDTFPMRRAEEELRESESLLRLIFERAPIAIGMVDLEGNILSANPWCSPLFGYSTQELETLNLTDLYPAEQRGHFAQMQEALLGGQRASIETEAPFLKKDGSHLIGFLRLALVRDEAGEPQMMVGLLEDVTQLRADEAELRQREEYLRLTFEGAPVGIAVADLDNRILDVNPSQCRLMGRSREEMIGRSLEEFVHPDDWPVAAKAIGRLHRGEAHSYALNGRFLRQDGKPLIASARGGMVRDAEGKPMMLINQMQDITRQEQALAERQRLRHYLQNIIDSMPSLLIGVDEQGRVTQWNVTAQQRTGLSTREAVGQAVEQLLPMFRPQLRKIHRAIASKQPYSAQRVPAEHNGKTGFVDLVVYPLSARDTAGAVIRVDDVTDRVRMEEIMIQTEKMLSVGGLAAGMAHEINNPLGAILQGAQNARRRLSPELAKNRAVAGEIGLDFQLLQDYLQARNILGFLDLIQESGNRASKIVNDMLGFSRRSEQHFQVVEPALLLDTSLRLAASDYDLKKRYDFKHIEIVKDYQAGLRVNCDKSAVEQVLLNLLRNAAQAMASGGQRSQRITLRSYRAPGQVVIEVEDNGPGMDEALRKRIFEPFFTTKEVGVGTGLGLSVSYFIISEQHRGSLSVESSPGKGSCFRIRLPAYREENT